MTMSGYEEDTVEVDANEERRLCGLAGDDDEDDLRENTKELSLLHNCLTVTGTLRLLQWALASATNERSRLIVASPWRAPVPAAKNGFTAAGNIRCPLWLIPLTAAGTLCCPSRLMI